MPGAARTAFSFRPVITGLFQLSCALSAGEGAGKHSFLGGSETSRPPRGAWAGLPAEGRLGGTPERLFPTEKRDGTRSEALTGQMGGHPMGGGRACCRCRSPPPAPRGPDGRVWQGPGRPTASPGDPGAGHSQVRVLRFLPDFQTSSRLFP